MVGRPIRLTVSGDKFIQNGSDIRGVAIAGVENEPVNLSPETVSRIGRSFVEWLAGQLDKKTADLVIAIGRDSRLSGPDLAVAVSSGIQAAGSKVYDCGLASTPAMFVSTITPALTCDGAIMLTASHLPFNRNGLKFFTNQGGLNKPDIAAILQMAESQNWQKFESVKDVESFDLISLYAKSFVKMIRQGVNHPTSYDKPLADLKIVVDAGNGAGGFFAEKVLQPLGADTTGSQFLDPDGHFPNHIPNPENEEAISSICQAVIDNDADFGIIFDTDVDRAAAVDSYGNPIARNRLIALIGSIILSEHPASTIVTDSITSDGLTKFIEDTLKGKHHRYKRGYKNVINESLRLNQTGEESWLAIETSGHAALRENYFLDDGAYLVTKLLIELARCNLIGEQITDRISSLREPLESVEIRTRIESNDFAALGSDVINRLEEFTTNHEGWEVVPNNYEGIRVACSAPKEDGWFLLRLSLHDPVLPLNIESNIDGGVRRITQELHQFFKSFTFLNLSGFEGEV